MLTGVLCIVCKIQVVLTILAVLQYRKGVSIGSIYGSAGDSYTDTGASPF